MGNLDYLALPWFYWFQKLTYPCNGGRPHFQTYPFLDMIGEGGKGSYYIPKRHKIVIWYFSQIKKKYMRRWKHWWIWFNVTQSDSIWFNLIQCDSMWFNLIQFDSIWFNLIQCDSMWFNLIQCDSMWFNLIQFDSIWFNLIQFDSMWFNVIQCDSIFNMHILNDFMMISKRV